MIIKPLFITVKAVMVTKYIKWRNDEYIASKVIKESQLHFSHLFLQYKIKMTNNF